MTLPTGKPGKACPQTEAQHLKYQLHRSSVSSRSIWSNAYISLRCVTVSPSGLSVPRGRSQVSLQGPRGPAPRSRSLGVEFSWLLAHGAWGHPPASLRENSGLFPSLVPLVSWTLPKGPMFVEIRKRHPSVQGPSPGCLQRGGTSLVHRTEQACAHTQQPVRSAMPSRPAPGTGTVTPSHRHTKMPHK